MKGVGAETGRGLTCLPVGWSVLRCLVGAGRCKKSQCPVRGRRGRSTPVGPSREQALPFLAQVHHKEKRLVLAVGPNGQEPTRNMGSLSGGERSIASLAFILALGKEVQPPFHAMDEFDVRRM